MYLSELLDIINGFKDNKDIFLDKISVNILKQIRKFVLDHLVFKYNLSNVQSIFPGTLKVADIKPL
jgi:predicted nuclease of restriction endonuclease-like RecB superfamily